MVFALLVSGLVFGAVGVEVTTVGDVPKTLENTVKKELFDVLSERTVAGPADTLQLTLVAGAINVRCIATRRSTGASMELDLAAGGLTFRPGIDEVVLRLFPERVKKVITVDIAAPAPDPAAALNVAPYVTAAASAALLIGGIVFGARASSGTDSLLEDPMSAADQRATLARIDREAMAANVLFISAAAGAVLSAALFFGAYGSKRCSVPWSRRVI